MTFYVANANRKFYSAANSFEETSTDRAPVSAQRERSLEASSRRYSCRTHSTCLDKVFLHGKLSGTRSLPRRRTVGGVVSNTSSHNPTGVRANPGNGAEANDENRDLGSTATVTTRNNLPYV